ncbi:hypothetical protein Q7C36_007115 [Tachysurus vachellii]|uniref:CARD domain-containing protein n=1 Tax=Tachysurus vachellii TaxID=175792 RepID=A0AA88T649_TACVA|nr:uncharacterized protein si:dkey-29h14.10 isoform X1 [Tachysurus vachellii]KAK2855246.1 hypothetical protein Q7C36_007115 [Tachysurus vachellii]
MDVVAPSSRMKVTSPDKVLQRELSTLSKCMPSCMVQQISDCLRCSRALTDYEVQVIRSGATDTQQAARLLQTLLYKGHTACLRFFQCLNACSPSLFHTITRGLVKVTDEAHHHVETSSCSVTTATVPPCVITINNSSLNNCIIGNNNSLCCLLSQTDVHDDAVEHTERNHQDRETSTESTEAPNVQVESSNIEYVIIGDNNYMNIESNLDPQLEEETDSVDEGS